MLRALPLLIAATPLFAHAQAAEAWQACTAIGDSAQRLACYDQWAQGQRPASGPAAVAPAAPAPAPSLAKQPVAPPVPAVVESRRGIRLTATEGCHDARYSELSRFWELERGADCGTFGLRGYRPSSLDVVDANRVNQQPTSDNPLNNATHSHRLPHDGDAASDFPADQARARHLLATRRRHGLAVVRATRSSRTGSCSRRSSRARSAAPDHEPELIYIAPVQSAQPGAWRMRLAGLGLVHQSNGQSLPLSRSWNRVYLMGAIERDNLQISARLWDRINESRANDDNPGHQRLHRPRRAGGALDRTARTCSCSPAARAHRGRPRLGEDRVVRTLADTGIGVPMGCACTRSCSRVTATRCWTTTSSARCSAWGSAWSNGETVQAAAATALRAALTSAGSAGPSLPERAAMRPCAIEQGQRRRMVELAVGEPPVLHAQHRRHLARRRLVAARQRPLRVAACAPAPSSSAPRRCRAPGRSSPSARASPRARPPAARRSVACTVSKIIGHTMSQEL